jgi:UDP-GlcNAc:undecaprenyl-phosphate GlcNAc-1-phosphate transferase
VLVGVVDEYRSLRPLTHLGGQIVAALVAMAAGVGIVHHVSAPSSLASPGFELPALAGFLFTLFWLVGAMNTVNFVDGLDGLAAGIACIAALLLALWARDPHRYLLPVTPHREDLILPLALAGALLGFLPFNWHVAKIFLGDSGSMFLGLAVGALSIIGPAKLGTALLILLVPVLDVAWAIVRRLLRGRNFLQGDKQHVYHRLMELGVSSTQTVLLFYLLCVALAVLDLSLLKIQKIVAFILLAACTIAAFAVIEVRATMRESQRRDRPAL